ncbi:Mu-like prophage major head subunit gpT family protein [Cognatishimia sp. MH4019]|uniref:Mu-like prophage major head subunit gpT family protein n=1 Tax=Cognatishimia sp. MH4019 TaxID=2854030 RepID=UPI001CD37317|nr:Mu-like prophage major head subunit gpT family protein [Cognatishimia sp. MH4019]
MPVAKRITRQVIERMTTGFKAIFQNAFTAADPKWSMIAEKVNSNTSIETYAWLAQIPGMKKWIDERRIKRLEVEAYTLKNDKFEDTIAVQREAIEDDQLGTYSMAIKGMATAAAEHPEELVFDALKEGFNVTCFDGQNFFDTDHPVMVDGEEVSVSNMQAGAGPTWYLLCTVKAVKPIIYQERIAAELETKDDASNSDHVFLKDEYLYGVRSRGAAGYTFWQLAFASKAPLTAANFKAARQAMASLKGDQGRPLNIVPNLLVIPPELETEAEEILKVKRTDGGKDNPHYGKAEILMTPWLS